MLEEQKDRVIDKGIDAATITISYFMCLSVRMKTLWSPTQTR